MSYPVWPASLPQSPRRGSWLGGVQEARAQFEADLGPPIVRRRTTADVEIFRGSVFPNLSGAARATFEAFFRDDLQGGALPFLMRDPVTQALERWRILGDGALAYSFTSKGADLHDLSLNLMRLPGASWFLPYLPAGSLDVPAMVLDFASGIYGLAGVRKSFSDLVTFSRAGTGTHFDADGVMRLQGDDVPRFDHAPASGTPLGLMVELASANLLARSQDFSTNWWSGALNGTLTAAAADGLDQTMTAGLITEDSAAGQPRHVANLTSVSFVSGSDYVASCYVRRAAGSRHFGLVFPDDAFTIFPQAAFDLDNGTALVTVSGTNTAAGIEDAGGGWWRCWLRSQATATIADNGIQYRLSNNPLLAAPSYTGDGASGLYLWGAQLEIANAPTSYIPTGTAGGVSRGADTAFVGASEWPAGMWSNGGSLQIAFLPMEPLLAGYRRVFGASLGNSPLDNIRVALDTTSFVYVSVGGVAQAVNSHGSFVNGVRQGIAASFVQDDFRSSRDGGAIVVDGLGALPAVDRAYIGQNATPVEKIVLWDKVLSDAELLGLSV